jgi:hypothetical protein
MNNCQQALKKYAVLSFIMALFRPNFPGLGHGMAFDLRIARKSKIIK